MPDLSKLSKDELVALKEKLQSDYERKVFDLNQAFAEAMSNEDDRASGQLLVINEALAKLEIKESVNYASPPPANPVVLSTS